MQSDQNPQLLPISFDEYAKRGKTLENLLIDKYVIFDKIGKGDSYEIYKGRNDSTKTNVIIKLHILKQIKEQKNQSRKRIKRSLAQSESKIMMMCCSPNLVKCLEIYANKDFQMMIIEYCNGKSLSEVIDINGRIPEEEALAIIKQVAEGLYELHKHRIIHRNLSTKNILQHNDSHKIIDFYFSSMLRIDKEDDEIAGPAFGSFNYIAPEILSGKPYGLKADVWSLGIVFFKMVYGVYPYQQYTSIKQFIDSYHEIHKSQLFKSPQPFETNGFKPSEQVYNFIKFLLVQRSSKRPSSSEVINHPIFKQIMQKNSNILSKIDEKAFDKKFQLLENSRQIQDLDKTILKESLHRSIGNNIKNLEQSSYDDGVSVIFSNLHVQTQKTSPYAQKQWHQNRIRMTESFQIPKKFIFEDEESLNVSCNINIRSLEYERLKMEEQEGDYIQFSKAKLIMQRVIKPMISLFPQDRSTNQFLHLLISRCLNNIILVRNFFKNGEKDYQKFRHQIQPLYNEVSQLQYENGIKITIHQSKIISVFGDTWNKIFKKKERQKKDIFLSAFEGLDFSKADQIQYTAKYYANEIKQQLAKVKKTFKGSEKSLMTLITMQKLLDNYSNINKLSVKIVEEKKKSFDAIVSGYLA